MEHWIKVYSKLRNWEWYRSPTMVAFWIHLLLEANWEDSVWRGIPIKRGQIITSIEQLAKNTGLTVRQTRTALNRLTKCGQIDKQTTNQFSIITICNYDRYQSKKEDERQTNDKRNDKRNVTQTTSETTTFIEINRVIENEEDNKENKQKKRFRTA